MIGREQTVRRPHSDERLTIALVGTRGVPAHYGGFETCVEEVGRRLADRGHRVVVYCRNQEGVEKQETFLGMELVHLPALRRRSLETLSHTALSVGHQVFRPADAAIVFNCANAPLLPLLRLRRIPVATHVDGLEWKRAKWSGTGQRYYKWAERFSVRWSKALIADAQGIADHYRLNHNAATDLISYGAPVLGNASDRLAELGLKPRAFHLVVARFEPENHVAEIVEGYTASGSQHPLVVVGSAPYAQEYTARIHAAADDRVRFVGGLWDQELLDQLYANATTYVHGHSVGGTNPSLLRALGGGAATLAFDVNFNREVLLDAGRYFQDPAQLAALLTAAETDPTAIAAQRSAARVRARAYTWDDVADRYENLCRRLAGRPVAAVRQEQAA